MFHSALTEMSRKVRNDTEVSYSISDLHSLLNLFTPTALEAAYKKQTKSSVYTSIDSHRTLSKSEKMKIMVPKLIEAWTSPPETKRLAVGEDWVYFGVGSKKGKGACQFDPDAPGVKAYAARCVRGVNKVCVARSSLFPHFLVPFPSVMLLDRFLQP